MNKKKKIEYKTPEEHKIIVNNNFKKIISMIESGYNIVEAVEKLGIDRSVFYQNITQEQRAEVAMAKTLNVKYGNRWR